MDARQAEDVQQASFTIKLLWISIFAFFAIRAVLLVMAGLLDVRATIDLLFDDAYYYLAVAYNAALNGMFSFDRMTETNGYQPLWLWILTFFESVFHFEKKAFFIFTLALITAVTAGPVLYCLKRWREPFYLSLAAGFVASYSCYPLVWLLGLETALFAPLMLAALFYIQRDGVLASRNKVALLCCVAVLIRLDAASLVISYGLLQFWLLHAARGWRHAIIESLRFGLPSALTLAAFFTFNKLTFGIAVPISGAAKMVGAQPFSNWGIAYHYLVSAQIIVVALALLLVVEGLWSKFRQGTIFYTGAAVLMGSAGIQYLYYALFSGWIPWPWYFYAFAMMLVLLVARVTQLLLIAPAAKTPVEASARFVCHGAALLFVLAANLAINLGMIRSVVENDSFAGRTTSISYNQRNLDDLRGLLNSDKTLTVAMGDRAGGLGYWAPSNVRVFQLEGLVADIDYLNARRTDQASQWLAEKIKPDLLVVDRESVPVVGEPGNRTYLIIEPIQGRVVFDHLLAFCFPEQAIVNKTIISRDDPSIILPNVQRYVFDMKKAVSCKSEYSEEAEQLIFSIDSPRREALETEYDDYTLNERLERFDRELALARRVRGNRTL